MHESKKCRLNALLAPPDRFALKTLQSDARAWISSIALATSPLVKSGSPSKLVLKIGAHFLRHARSRLKKLLSSTTRDPKNLVRSYLPIKLKCRTTSSHSAGGNSGRIDSRLRSAGSEHRRRMERHRLPKIVRPKAASPPGHPAWNLGRPLAPGPWALDPGLLAPGPAGPPPDSLLFPPRGLPSTYACVCI